MKKQINLTVKTPCIAEWTDFTTTQDGGFCESCSKNVIDFTAMTDEEVLSIIQNKPQHICGRFQSGQLKSYAKSYTTSSTSPKKWLNISLLSLFLAGIAGHSFAQASNSVKEPQTISFQKEKLTEINEAEGDHLVAGMVIDEEGKALPGINVYLKNDISKGTVTDNEGKFKFPEKLREGDIVVFAFLGFEKQEYTVSSELQDNIQVQMLSFTQILGELSVDEVYALKPSAISRTWNKFKSLF